MTQSTDFCTQLQFDCATFPPKDSKAVLTNYGLMDMDSVVLSFLKTTRMAAASVRFSFATAIIGGLPTLSGTVTIEDAISVEGAVRSAEGAEPIMSLLLTDEERQRFADWLEMSADSNEQIAAQIASSAPSTAQHTNYT
jgi:hypothetical protein